MQAQGAGSGRSALVIGGAGKMGRWFARFLASQGFAVEIADPAGAPPGFTAPGRLARQRAQARLHRDRDAARHHRQDPARARHAAPEGVIFDVGSLKSPAARRPPRAQVAGCRVTSLHPMFGPDTELLSGRHVIFVEVGSAEATAAARELFASTMVEQVVMSLDEHDRLIAYVLGLSHALNIAFFTALAESGEAAPRLATAVVDHVRLAARRGREGRAGEPGPVFRNPESQRLRYRIARGAAQAVERLRSAVISQNFESFAALMRRGREYLEDRRSVTERRA